MSAGTLCYGTLCSPCARTSELLQCSLEAMCGMVTWNSPSKPKHSTKHNDENHCQSKTPLLKSPKNLPMTNHTPKAHTSRPAALFRWPSSELSMLDPLWAHSHLPATHGSPFAVFAWPSLENRLAETVGMALSKNPR